LGDELEMLMEAVLDIDANITMPNKASLYKTIEWQEETLTPQQKDLLLYVDNELPASQKLALESQLKNNKALQSDLASLAKTKLAAEVVEMPEKEELYRKENNRRPIPIMVMRWMAAAAVMAGLGWFSLSVFTKQPKTDEPVVASNIEKKESPKTPAAKTDNNPASQNLGLEDSSNHTNENQNGTNATLDQTDVASEPKIKATKVESQKQGKQPVETIANPKIDGEVPQIAVNNTPKGKETTLTPTKSIVEDPLAVLAAQHNIPKNDVTAPTLEIAKLDPVTETPTYSNPDDRIEEPEYVNIAGARIKKQKVRGLLRSVTRTVGRAFDKSNVAQADVATLK